jgi:hypothetical protein
LDHIWKWVHNSLHISHISINMYWLAMLDMHITLLMPIIKALMVDKRPGPHGNIMGIECFLLPSWKTWKMWIFKCCYTSTFIHIYLSTVTTPTLH